MTARNTHNTAYRLLKFMSRQPLKFSRFFANGLANLVNILKISKTSETVRLNLRISLPNLNPIELEDITRQAIRNELKSYFEFFNIWGADNTKNISRIHNIYGKTYLDEALGADNGLVLIVPHFGTWEIMNAYISQFTDMTIMYKPIKNEGADQFVREARSREGSNLVPTDESGVRQIFKALKQGGTTVILPDHTPNVGGEMVEYFGIPLASSNLSAKLIQKTKAKALLLYAMRNDQDGFDMFVEPLNPKIYEGTANNGTQVIHEAIEHLILRHPSHYHWSYKRFKANPALRELYNIPKQEALEKIHHIRMEQQLKQT